MIMHGVYELKPLISDHKTPEDYSHHDMIFG